MNIINIMKLVLGVSYTVLKTDGSTVSFKFIGGEPPRVVVDGKTEDLYSLLSGGFLSYWENEIDK